MRVEFRKVVLPRELRSLVAMDRKIFPRGDVFPASDWNEYENWWLIVDRVRVGCCALQKHVEKGEQAGEHAPLSGFRKTLYIGSTGILPRMQGKGLGALLKSWQIAYARYHQFDRIVANTRKSNRAMVELNRKFGFRRIRTTPGYYTEPDEPTVVMELLLPRSLEDRKR